MHNAIVGIDLGGTKLLICCGDQEARFDTGPLFSPQSLRHHLDAFLAHYSLAPTHIGLAVPGLVDDAGKIIACDVLPAFAGWVPSLALAGLNSTVVVLNDVKAALLEEMDHMPPASTGAVIMVGTAIGAALITSGRPMPGTSGWAGELGYLPIAVNNHVKRLDELAAGAGIATASGISSAQLVQRASAADPVTLEAIRTGGRFLGLGLAALINLLNPARVAVGGGTLELPGYWEAAQASAAQNTIPALWTDCILEKARAGTHVVVKGAMRAAQAEA